MPSLCQVLRSQQIYACSEMSRSQSRHAGKSQPRAYWDTINQKMMQTRHTSSSCRVKQSEKASCNPETCANRSILQILRMNGSMQRKGQATSVRSPRRRLPTPGDLAVQAEERRYEAVRVRLSPRHTVPSLRRDDRAIRPFAAILICEGDRFQIPPGKRS